MISERNLPPVELSAKKREGQNFRTKLLPPGSRKNEGFISYNALEDIYESDCHTKYV